MRAGPGSRTGGRSRLPPPRRTPTAPPSAAGVAGSSRGACRPVRLVCGQGSRTRRFPLPGGGGIRAVRHLIHRLRKRASRNVAPSRSPARGPGGLSLRPRRGPVRARRDMGPGPGGRGAAGWGRDRGGVGSGSWGRGAGRGCGEGAQGAGVALCGTTLRGAGVVPCGDGSQRAGAAHAGTALRGRAVGGGQEVSGERRCQAGRAVCLGAVGRVRLALGAGVFGVTGPLLRRRGTG